MSSYSFIILLLEIFFISSFGFPGLGNGLRSLKKEFNADILDSESAIIKRKWIVQPLNHFNDTEKRTWEMRYLERHDMWKSGGPIYFLIGHGDFDRYLLSVGLFYDLAKETNGVLFLSERRYYGPSRPLVNVTAANLIYLNSRQVLADNARLIENIKLNASYRNSKVVTLGGDNSGHLAAWMKLKYPTIVDAAIASSARVLAKVDFSESYESVNDDFKKYGSPGCLDKISKKFQRFKDLLKTQEGIAELIKEEKLCGSIDFSKQEDREQFFNWEISKVLAVTWWGSPKDIVKFCSHLNVSMPNKISRSTVVWDEKRQCHDYSYEFYLKFIKSYNYAWVNTYEICTEYGYFTTTNSDKQPFTKSIPMEHYYKLCMDLFGAEFDKKRMEDGVRKTNAMYGGLHPNVTHVIFVYGEMDPFIKLGILKDLSPDTPARVIPHISHDRFIYPNSTDDSEVLKETRKYVKNLIKQWIGAEDTGI